MKQTGLTMVVAGLVMSAVAGLPRVAHAGQGPSIGCVTPPPAVIVDTDVDFDDTVALAYLCALHSAGRIELKAVTVTNDGSGYPGDAIRNARCVLQACGEPNIPIADGSDEGVNAFTPAVREAVGGIIDGAFTSCTASTAPASITAAQLIQKTIIESDRPVTLVTLGPLTNVATALSPSHPLETFLLSAKIDRAFIVGGAVHVAGNVIPPAPFPPPAGNFNNTQELNIWADPASAQAVFGALNPLAIHLLANDATDQVPVTVDFINRLAADHTTPAATVANTLVQQPFFLGAIEGGVSFSWADPLDAVASETSTVVSYEWDKISVVQSGPSAGRTVSVGPFDAGAWMQVAIKANATAFDNDLINTLNDQ